jgi:ATP-dependent DNA helicase RecG
MVQKNPLKSIIIGDVGSGKTVVSLIVLITYLNSQKKSVGGFMVPTSLLAKQHYQSLLDILNFDQAGWDLILYTQGEYLLNGQKTTKIKLLKTIQKDKQIWIGTQALLFVENLNLDILIIDEQHRFGVNQRQDLIHKSTKVSHFISLTATPIPRTLALSLYADLNVYTLESFRNKNISTKIIPKQNWLQEVDFLIRQTLEKNQKVYIICAKVEDKENDSEDIISLNSAYNSIAKKFPSKVLKVHGQEKTKIQILQNFKSNSDYQILVSTTVVEVGVDVPEASLMIILDAERFGLAALHQIRGRIGRNNYEHNTCLLVAKNPKNSRLKILEQTLDGFKISVEDLKLRGKGSLIGKLQSGYDPETEILMNLKNNHKIHLQESLDQINFANLETELPRLQSYLAKITKNIWSE